MKFKTCHQNFNLAIVSVLILLISGCGFYLQETKSRIRLPKNAEKVFVDAVINNTTKPGIHFVVKSEIEKLFAASNRLNEIEYLSDEALQINLTSSTYAIGSDTNSAQEFFTYYVTITGNYQLYDLRENRALIHSQSISASVVYQSFYDVIENQEKEDAYLKAAKMFALKLTKSINDLTKDR